MKHARKQEDGGNIFLALGLCIILFTMFIVKDYTDTWYTLGTQTLY